MKRKKLLSGILALSCALTLLPAAPVSASEPQTGTFTAVSMNVDGLPTDLLGFININEGGPGRTEPAPSDRRWQSMAGILSVIPRILITIRN